VCKVADFGLARVTTSVKTCSSSSSSSEEDGLLEEVYEAKRQTALPIRWMSPESLFQGLFGFKSDVWSFGILVWEIVTLGSTPYPGMSASQVAKSVQVGKTMSCPNHCRQEVFDLMKSCWSRESRDRPTFKQIKSLLQDMIDTQQKREVDYIDISKFCERNYCNEDLIDTELPEKL
jgi:serine/threonine protein kinase